MLAGGREPAEEAAAMELAAVLRATVTVTCLVAILTAVLTAWVKLEETPEQFEERVSKERGQCDVGYFECEKQLKTFERCSAISAADTQLCDDVQRRLLDGNSATCENAGGGGKCTYTNRPGVRVGQPLCIPDSLVRNGYYDCIGTQEACTAIDEGVEADVTTCAAVALDGRAVTCTGAGNCKHWGVDTVSDFSDEKCASSLFLLPVSLLVVTTVIANRLSCVCATHSLGVANVSPCRCDRDSWWVITRVQLLQIDQHHGSALQKAEGPDTEKGRRQGRG